MLMHPVLQLKLDGRCLIEASAGTGKTWSIAKLFVRALLEKKLLPRDVLVVTFTNAATGELKERLYRELLECEQWLTSAHLQNDANDETPNNDFYRIWFKNRIASEPEVDLEKTLVWLRRCIHRFDEAAISTLQGFCEGLVVRYGIEFGIELVAENESAKLSASSNGITAAVSSIYRREVEFINQLNNDSPAFFRFALGSFNQLLKNVMELLQKPAVKTLIEAKPCEQARKDLLSSSIFSAFNEFQKSVNDTSIQSFIQYGNDLLACGQHHKGITPKQFNEAVFGLQNLAKYGTLDKALLTRLDKLTKGLISKTELSTPTGLQRADTLPIVIALTNYLAAYREFEKEADEFRQHVLLAAYSQAKAALLDGNDSSFKQTNLGFTRTLLLAAQGLSKEAGVARQVAARYPVALVDEFQDTDPTQAAILNAIYPPVAQNHGSALNYTLVMVGDPKQAIYNFRGADVYAYLKAKSTATQVYSLDTNQRSTEELVEAVNRLFVSLPEVFNVPGIDFSTVHSSTRHQKELAGPAMRYLYLPQQAKPRNTERQEDDEEQEDDLATFGQSVWVWIAQEIAKLLGTRSLNGEPLKASDIAVLVRSNRNAVLMRDALTARKIASRLESKESIWTQSFAQQLVWFLEGVASFNDAPVLRKALMTPLGDWVLSALDDKAAELSNIRGLSDRVITFFAQARNTWVNDGFAAFWTSLALAGETASRFSQLRQLIEIALVAPVMGQMKIQEPAQLIAWLQNEIDIAIEASKLQLADPDFRLRTPAGDNQVQLSTIHASKGLEYKVVFLPDALAKPRAKNASNGITFFERDLSLMADLQNSKFQSIDVKEAASREQDREEIRLLYVAVTRAIQCCYLFYENTQTAKKSKVPERRVLTLLKNRFEMAPPASIELAVFSDESWGSLSIDLPIHPDPLQNRSGALTNGSFSALKTLPVDQTQARWLIDSFSALARRSANETHVMGESGRSGEISEVSLATDPSSQRFADLLPKGARTGECLHAILEKSDWQQPLFEGENLQVVARFQTQFGLNGVDTSALAHWMDTLLDTPMLQSKPFSLRGVAPGKMIREWRFDTQYGAANSRANYLRGFVDLIFEHEGYFYVVDYKSNWLGETEASYTADAIARVMLAHQYDLQARIYAAALRNFLATRLGPEKARQSFGGVLYLFLRAMRPEQIGQGIFHVLD
jgi:exodeoxyribonuclease V beta subunit